MDFFSFQIVTFPTLLVRNLTTFCCCCCLFLWNRKEERVKKCWNNWTFLSIFSKSLMYPSRSVQAFLLFFFFQWHGRSRSEIIGGKKKKRVSEFLSKNNTEDTIFKVWIELGVGREGWRKEKRMNYIWINMNQFIRYFSQSNNSPPPKKGHFPLF